MLQTAVELTVVEGRVLQGTLENLQEIRTLNPMGLGFRVQGSGFRV